jgi:hypothetical protein
MDKKDIAGNWTKPPHWIERKYGHYVSCHTTLTSPLLRGKELRNIKLTKQLHPATSIKSTPKFHYGLVLCIYLSTLFSEVQVHTSSIHHCELKVHIFHLYRRYFISDALCCIILHLRAFCCVPVCLTSEIEAIVLDFRYKVYFNNITLSIKSHRNQAGPERRWHASHVWAYTQ